MRRPDEKRTCAYNTQHEKCTYSEQSGHKWPIREHEPAVVYADQGNDGPMQERRIIDWMGSCSTAFIYPVHLNADEEAPIMKTANMAVVGDAKQVLSAMLEALAG